MWKITANRRLEQDCSNWEESAQAEVTSQKILQHVMALFKNAN